MRDVMQGHGYAEVRCLYTKNLYRRLTVRGDNLVIDAIGVQITVPMDTPLHIERWLPDLGAVMFPAPACTDLPPVIAAMVAQGTSHLKLCGERDAIHYTLEGVKDRVEAADIRWVPFGAQPPSALPT
jgi:hypothetical protein